MITGFSSPAAGYEDNLINLNTLLIKHPSATIFMEIKSSKFRNMGIYDGDLLIIDRSKRISNHSLVVFEKDGSFTLGRFCDIKGPTIVTGAVIHVIHTVKEL